MKFCILGNTNNPVTGKPNDPYSWFVKTFVDGLLHNGHSPLLIDYKSSSLDKIKSFLINNKITHCFIHMIFHGKKNLDKELGMYQEVTKKIGTRFIHVVGDARTHDRHMGDVSHAIHLGLVGTRPLVDNCSPAWNIPVVYMPYSSLTYKEMGTYQKNLDFHLPLFTGNAHGHPDRSNFIRRLEQIMNIKIITTQSGQDLRNQTLDLSSSSVILGLCTGYDIDGYIDVRPFQYLGAGACMIMRKFKGMDDIIPEDLYYSFNSYDDPNIVLDYWNMIQHTDTLPMRKQAFEYIQEHHSSKVRLKQIIDILKGL